MRALSMLLALLVAGCSSGAPEAYTTNVCRAIAELTAYADVFEDGDAEALTLHAASALDWLTRAPEWEPGADLIAGLEDAGQSFGAGR